MPTRNVHLSDYFDRFISERIAAGRFSNASEVVRDALRLLEQREREEAARIEWLRTAAQEGFDALDRGEYTELNSRREVKALLEEIRAEAGVSRKR